MLLFFNTISTMPSCVGKTRTARSILSMRVVRNKPGLKHSFQPGSLHQKNPGLVRAALLSVSITYNHFLFDDYKDVAADYSGNDLTGVPQQVFVSALTIRFQKQLSLFVESYSSARIPLNDGNTVHANPYHVLGAKLSWSTVPANRLGFEVFAGADNITNTKYSLGNDLNAFGGRYFNAAALFTFYAGMNMRFQ